MVEWNQQLNSVLELLKKDLGLPDNIKLQPDLHNLLIYEPGQFFNYHQDLEKLDGMIATLIIILPSEHKGGTLILDHQGIKKQFYSSRFPIDQLTLIAFYADCHHKVNIVKEGYRLALTYNLIVENNNNKIDIVHKKNYYEPVINSLDNYFFKVPEVKEDCSLKRYVYLLDHSYTHKSLSWDLLKNGDILRAKALKIAALDLDLEIYMALADIQETWDCEVDYDYYKYRRLRRKYSYYEKNNKNEPQDLNSIPVNQLVDTSTVLKHWINQDNKSLDYKECHVSNNYIGWTKASNEFQPFQSEHEDYMGNYGNTLDHWYHRAAIILWKKQDHYLILFEMDPSEVIKDLLISTKDNNNILKNKSQIHKIISMLLPYWSKYLSRVNDYKCYVNIFDLSLYINDPKLAKDMIIDFNIKILNSEITTLFLSLQKLYGTSWCIDVLEKWTMAQGKYNAILKDFSELIKILHNNSNQTELTIWLIRYQYKEIIKNHKSCKTIFNRVQLLARSIERINEILDFMQSCIVVNNAIIWNELLDQVINDIELYPAIDLVSIIVYLKNCSQNLEKWGYKKLFNYVLNLLKKEKNLGLRSIDDWSINEKVPCNCNDCQTLSEFLQKRNLITIKWPLSKEHRMHIHRVINGLGIPVSHNTEHTGSPHKLILVKTNQLYEAAKKRFSNLEKALIELINLNKTPNLKEEE